MNATDIVGYTYHVENYTPENLVEAMIAAGELSPAAREMGAEAALDQLANGLGIDRYEEHSFDSSEFPKVIFGSQVDLDYDAEWLGI